jgi:outer membrane protein assembly factor BamD
MDDSMKYMGKVFLLVSLLALVACKSLFGGHDEEDNPYQSMTAEQLYTASRSDLDKKEYSAAIKHLEALDTMYPFNDQAELAQRLLIYAYYEKEDYPSSAATADRFIHLYPRSHHVDYAYYMKGMADFNQPRGALMTMIPMDQSKRDPGSQVQAYSDFATLVQKFPQSRYKPNALQRMIYLRNMFAQRELNMAKYYYSRKMYVAAVERAGFLIKTYPQASCVRQALEVIYFGNKHLDLPSAADDALQVYRATYHAMPKRVQVLDE